MRASKIVFLFLIFTFSSCSNKSADQAAKDSTAQATFVVDPVTANIDSKNNGTLYQSIANEKLVNFKACVKDVALLNPIIGVSFAIQGDNGSTIKSTITDSQGCLYWSESIPYNSLANETYINLSRSIEAENIHKGKQSLQIAVDPWQKGSSAVVDLRYQSAPKTTDAKSASMLSMADSASSLYVETVLTEIDIVQSQTAQVSAMMHISMQPKTRRVGIDGNSVLESLTRGRFKLRSQLIAKDPDSISALNLVAESFADFSDGIVKADFPINFVKKFNKESLIEMDLEITPVDAPAGLRPIKGVVTLGQLTSLTTTNNAIFRSGDFTFFDLQKTPTVVVANASGTISTSAGTTNTGGDLDFVVGKIDAERVLVAATDKSGRPSRLTIFYKTCLKNAISSAPILGQHFTVTMGTEVTPLVSDEETGCLSWQSTLSFNYFAKENYIEKKIQIQSQESFYGNGTKEVNLFLNPWEYNVANLFSIDERYGTPSSTASTVGSTGSRSNTGSELVIQSVSFNFVKRDFTIDNNLDLSVIRSYSFDIRPLIRRMTVQGWKDESIGNGQYMLRVLVESLGDGAPVPIAGAEQRVSADADAIIATVPLRFDDLRQVAARSQISFELTPLEHGSSLSSKAYVGNFDTGMNASTVRAAPRSGSIAGLVARAMHHGGFSSNGPTLMQKAFGFEAVTKEKATALGILPTDVDNFFSGNTALLTKFCPRFFANNQSDLGNCKANPRSYLATAYSEHVMHVRKKVLTASDVWTIRLASAINYRTFNQQEHTTGSTFDKHVHAEVEASTKTIPVVSWFGVNAGVAVGMGKSWFNTNTNTLGQTTSRYGDTGQAKMINVDNVNFDLTVDAEKCLAIKASRVSNSPTEFICSSKLETKTAHESYYYLYQDFSADPMMDSGAQVDQRPFMSLIRGKARYDAFARLLQNNTPLILDRGLPLPSDLANTAQSHYDGLFPGLLTPEGF